MHVRTLLHMCVCMHAAICIAQAIRKTSFTAPVKLARGSPQDVHTPDLPIVNRLNSVFLNLLCSSLALPLGVLMGCLRVSSKNQ